jgi:hypothetical protein
MGTSVMSTYIFFFGLILILSAMNRRFERRGERQEELTKLERDLKTKTFWGRETEREDKEHKAKIAEQKGWRNNIKCELGNWGVIATGAVIWAVAAVVWMSEDPTHTFDQLLRGEPSRFPLYVFFGWLVMYWWYRFSNRLEKAENEIAWLSQMLEAVKINTEDMRRGSNDNFWKEVNNRMEGKSG